jgi:hypothetical protein
LDEVRAEWRKATPEVAIKREPLDAWLHQFPGANPSSNATSSRLALQTFDAIRVYAAHSHALNLEPSPGTCIPALGFVLPGFVWKIHCSEFNLELPLVKRVNHEESVSRKLIPASKKFFISMENRKIVLEFAYKNAD